MKKVWLLSYSLVFASLVWFGLAMMRPSPKAPAATCPACEEHGTPLTPAQEQRTLQLAANITKTADSIIVKDEKGGILLEQHNNAKGLPVDVSTPKYGIFKYYYNNSGNVSRITRTVGSHESDFLVPEYQGNRLEGVWSAADGKYRDVSDLPHLSKSDPAVRAISEKLGATPSALSYLDEPHMQLVQYDATGCQLCKTQYNNCVSGAQSNNQACGLACTATFFAYVAGCALVPPPGDLVCWGIGMAAEVACFNQCSVNYNNAITGCTDTLNLCNHDHNCNSGG